MYISYIVVEGCGRRKGNKEKRRMEEIEKMHALIFYNYTIIKDSEECDMGRAMSFTTVH